MKQCAELHCCRVFRHDHALDHNRLLGRSGLRVSPLALGTMTFGVKQGWGTDDAEARRIFDCYTEHGGNSIDTANFYAGGESERVLGELLQGRRNRFVVATKYSLTTRAGDPNASGNHRKNMMASVEDSLRRLNTDHIDLLYLHVWNLGALEISFNDEQVAQLQTVSAIEPGFPHAFLNSPAIGPMFGNVKLAERR